MNKIGIEFYCRECEHTRIIEERQYECPECGSENVCNSSFIVCECGTTIYLDRFTNECPECGKLYNGFGEELAPVDEWEKEDWYGTFGPQNDNEDW